MIIRMPIDLKSLYLNIRNDNKTGHTPTVATPLRQGSSIHTEIAQILDIPETIPVDSKERLSLQLLAKSRADAKIVKAYLFDNISVNGIPVDTDASYCIYIREETDPTNVHFGRQKVHYPQVLAFEDENIRIDNKSVIHSISSVLSDYAFIVQAFEYNTANGVLNFDVLLAGYNSIPYSKVFMIKRGVGDKFVSIFNEFADIYDSEIVAMRGKLGYDNVDTENFMQVMADNKEKAINLVMEQIRSTTGQNCTPLSLAYPYSLYDIEVKDIQHKKYIIVRFSSTRVPYFNLSNNIIRFINDFPEQAEIYLVTDINGSPHISKYCASDLLEMKKIISAVTYQARSV